MLKTIGSVPSRRVSHHPRMDPRSSAIPRGARKEKEEFPSQAALGSLGHKHGKLPPQLPTISTKLDASSITKATKLHNCIRGGEDDDKELLHDQPDQVKTPISYLMFELRSTRCTACLRMWHLESLPQVPSPLPPLSVRRLLDSLRTIVASPLPPFEP